MIDPKKAEAVFRDYGFVPSMNRDVVYLPFRGNVVISYQDMCDIETPEALRNLICEKLKVFQSEMITFIDKAIDIIRGGGAITPNPFEISS